jgi:uncharacterized protein YecE (DUF72 family)
MQDDLFGLAPAPTPCAKPNVHPVPPPGESAAATAPPGRTRKSAGVVSAAADDGALKALALALPPQLRLGTSSWTYPGWKGLVWAGDHSPAQLSKNGLAVYAQHPLLRTVSIDRGFYRPLTVSEYERYASQVPDDFRFVVKAPSLVTDALVRSEDGRGRQPNPAFLDADLARTEFVEPALQGLGRKLGALVFQISPLPLAQLDHMAEPLRRLRAMLLALPAVAPTAPDGVLAVEVRDPQWLTPEFVEVLRAAGATYCLGLHPKLPPLQEQLPLLRALWPGPLVCRWNLHPVHGPYGYEDAERIYAPYDRLHDPDLSTRAALAKVIAGTTRRGQNAFVTISNHAEGCAPASVRGLAEHVAEQLAAHAGNGTSNPTVEM